MQILLLLKILGLSEIQISGEESTFPQQSALDMIEQSKQVIQNILKFKKMQYDTPKVEKRDNCFSKP